MSAQQISDITGLDRKTVAGILSGENENPKLETVSAIAKALGGEIIFSTPDSRAAVSSGSISYYRSMIASLQAEVDNRANWLRYFFWTCIGLTGVIVVVCIISMLLLFKL